MRTPTNPVRWAGLPALLLVALAAPASGAPVTGGQSAPLSVGSAGGATPQAKPVGTSTRGPSPVVTGVSCVGTGQCGADPHIVRRGGRLVIRGRGLAPGLLVIFPPSASAAARRRTVGARLRRTSHGLVVSVPAEARSGRIVVVSAAGLRSRPFGPVSIVVRLPTTTGSATPHDIQPTGTALDGTGMWIWYVSKSDGGRLQTLIADAKAAGIRTLYVKSGDGSSNYWSQFSPALVQTLHQQGLRVCAWQYVYGTHPAAEATLGAQAVQTGADCLVIDAESEYEGRYSSAQSYIRTLRAAVGPSYPVGLASFPYVDYHQSLPYSVFLGPGGAQFNLPQMYWHEIGTTVDNVFSHTYQENRLYGRPILPLGQTYGGTPTAQIFRFRQLAVAYNASGLSFWDWQETTAGGFAAISRPLTPATGVVADTTYPLFSQGARGDQVVWMQEHLASAEPQTPTTGVFDATTKAALIAFQAASGLPQSGTTDVASWRALLRLAPVAVDWTGSAGA